MSKPMDKYKAQIMCTRIIRNIPQHPDDAPYTMEQMEDLVVYLCNRLENYTGPLFAPPQIKIKKLVKK